MKQVMMLHYRNHDFQPRTGMRMEEMVENSRWQI